MREALVEHHRDVRSEPRLDVGGALRRQRVRRAVEMRSEVCAVLVDRPPRRQTEHLVAAAVGEDRTIPADKAMEPAAARDQLVAGTQIQMVGVREQDRRAHRLEVAVRDALDRALRADRHERRRLDCSMRRREHAAPRAAVGVRHAKIERGPSHHRSTVYNLKTAATRVLRGGFL